MEGDEWNLNGMTFPALFLPLLVLLAIALSLFVLFFTTRTAMYHALLDIEADFHQVDLEQCSDGDVIKLPSIRPY